MFVCAKKMNHPLSSTTKQHFLFYNFKIEKKSLEMGGNFVHILRPSQLLCVCTWNFIFIFLRFQTLWSLSLLAGIFFLFFLQHKRWTTFSPLLSKREETASAKTKVGHWQMTFFLFFLTHLFFGEKILYIFHILRR